MSLISRSCGNIARVPSALGQYSRNFGKLDSLLTSMPVTICIMFLILFAKFMIECSYVDSAFINFVAFY